jgi:hypothetical protein
VAGQAARRPRTPPDRTRATRLIGLFDALSTVRGEDGFRGCAVIDTTVESDPGTAVHARTVAHKRRVGPGWVTSPPTRAPATPDALACARTVLLDGALAAREREPGGDAAAQAKAAARTLVDGACAGR